MSRKVAIHAVLTAIILCGCRNHVETIMLPAKQGKGFAKIERLHLDWAKDFPLYKSEAELSNYKYKITKLITVQYGISQHEKPTQDIIEMTLKFDSKNSGADAVIYIGTEEGNNQFGERILFIKGHAIKFIK